MCWFLAEMSGIVPGTTGHQTGSQPGPRPWWWADSPEGVCRGFCRSILPPSSLSQTLIKPYQENKQISCTLLVSLPLKGGRGTCLTEACSVSLSPCVSPGFLRERREGLVCSQNAPCPPGLLGTLAQGRGYWSSTLGGWALCSSRGRGSDRGRGSMHTLRVGGGRSSWESPVRTDSAAGRPPGLGCKGSWCSELHVGSRADEPLTHTHFKELNVRGDIG